MELPRNTMFTGDSSRNLRSGSGRTRPPYRECFLDGSGPLSPGKQSEKVTMMRIKATLTSNTMSLYGKYIP